MSDEDDDLYESVERMADRLHLEGREKERYIHEHMTRGGYRAIPQYVRDEEEEDGRGRDRGSGFFGSDRDRDRDRDRGSRRRSDRGRDDRRDRDREDHWYD